MKFHPPDEIWIERGVADTPLARRVLERAPDVKCELIDDGARTHERFSNDPAGLARGKRVLVLAKMKGAFFKPCPCAEGCQSCGYDILHYADNCSMGCTYCILQDLVNNPALVIYANISDIVSELDAMAEAQPQRRFRIGTGEFADSLDLEPLTGYAAELVEAFARHPNVSLELKTKTDFVDGLIGLNPGAAVVGWSVNSERIVNEEERMTASLEQRLEAARRVSEAGYHVGFHFDPMIHYPGWQEGYAGLIDRIVEKVDVQRIQWVSIGALRFPPAMKSVIRRRYPFSPILDGEMVIGSDGKMRYFQPIRVEMFRYLAELIRRRLPGVGMYLCMEPPEVWRRALGRTPDAQQILAETLDHGAHAAC